jgi:starch synthase
MLLCYSIFFWIGGGGGGLLQITERRKLVSSIKDSIINQEDDEVSNEGRGTSSPNLDLSSASEKSVDNHNSGIPSNSYAHLTVDEEPETLPSDISQGFDEVKKESGKGAPERKISSDVDSTNRLKDTNSERDWSDGLPSFLSSSSKSSSLRDENHEIFNKTSLAELDGEANDPVIEEVKPPPLAGANVMNIIFVAAECAPWSKTGIV